MRACVPVVYVCVHRGDAHRCTCMQRQSTCSVLLPCSLLFPEMGSLEKAGARLVASKPQGLYFHLPPNTGVTGFCGSSQFLKWVLQILSRVPVPAHSLSWCPFLWALAASGIHTKEIHAPGCPCAAYCPEWICPEWMLDSRETFTAGGCGIPSQWEAVWE